jgi:hypothetical protein
MEPARAAPHPAFMKLSTPLVALIAFTAWSLYLVVGESPVGFLTLAWREPWAAQMLTDLAVACFLVSTWMVRDARTHRIPVAPYLVATLLLGSIGPLAYLVHREVRGTSRDRSSGSVRLSDAAGH